MSVVSSDAEDTEEKAKKLCMCACVGFTAFPILLILIFFNEKDYVCASNFIASWSDASNVVACNQKTAATGDVVHLQGAL